MFNKTEIQESQTKRTEKKSTFFQKINFKILKHYFTCYAILLTLCLFSATLCQAAEKSQLVKNLEAGKRQVIVTYGTSLTSVGAWVHQLQAALNSQYPGKATVVNAGKGGSWSNYGVANLDKQVIAKNPDVVFIEFAMNDSVLRFKASPKICRDNLENMITRILKARPECEIILMTMNPSTAASRPKLKDFYQVYRDVAKERKLLLIDHYINWKKIMDTDPKLFKKYIYDGIHSTNAGCKMVVTPQIIKDLGLAHSKK